jgi:hypothetical protein
VLCVCATGIPYHRVNLRHGKIPKETTNTCTAAGGSFLVEMCLLSLLSGAVRVPFVSHARANDLTVCMCGAL